MESQVMSWQAVAEAAVFFGKKKAVGTVIAN